MLTTEKARTHTNECGLFGSHKVRYRGTRRGRAVSNGIDAKANDALWHHSSVQLHTYGFRRGGIFFSSLPMSHHSLSSVRIALSCVCIHHHLLSPRCLLVDGAALPWCESSWVQSLRLARWAKEIDLIVQHSHRRYMFSRSGRVGCTTGTHILDAYVDWVCTFPTPVAQRAQGVDRKL